MKASEVTLSQFLVVFVICVVLGFITIARLSSVLVSSFTNPQADNAYFSTSPNSYNGLPAHQKILNESVTLYEGSEVTEILGLGGCGCPDCCGVI